MGKTPTDKDVDYEFFEPYEEEEEELEVDYEKTKRH